MADSLLGLFCRKIKVSLVSAQKKRVLFVTSSLNLGGAERQLLMLCLNLETQVDVQIVSLESEGPLKEKYLQSFPEILFLNEKKSLSQVNELRKIIGISKPDVVVTWLYKADLLGGLAAKLAGDLPVIWSARNSAIPNFSNSKKILLSICSRIIPRAIVANGLPAYRFHKSLGYPESRMLTIPNLLATWTRNATSNSRLLVEDFPINYLRVGIAARQVSGKGILESIKSLEDRQDQLPIIELTIIGQETRESVGWSERGLYRSHIVTAIESDFELCEWFVSLDLYVMPSTAWESQPNSLLEAIAIGCPVLISDSIEFSLDLPDTLKFNSNSSQDLIAAINGIAKLGSSEILKITEAARTNLRSVYNEENAINEWLKILEV